MDQMVEHYPPRIVHEKKRQPYRRSDAPHALRDWFKHHPEMKRGRFAVLVGCTDSYVSQLCADNAPWPRREIVRRIGEVTAGEVSPNVLAGYSPD